MQETEEKTTDVFYRFRKRDILKENGLRRNGKGRIRMKRAYYNCILLDGTEQMEPVAHKMVLVDGEKITAIVEENAPCEGYEKVDLKGGYLMPGLINLHVHLAGNGKPSAKPRDNAALVRRILSNGLTRAVAYRLVCSYAKLELLGGVTTIRTVGGLADFDTRCRDDAAKGKMHCLTRPFPALPRRTGTMAGSSLTAWWKVPERPLPTAFRWVWAMTWAAPTSHSMISGGSCATSTNTAA